MENAEAVMAKVAEELEEVRSAAVAGDDAHVTEEIGDLLLAVVNLSRTFGIDPEASLANATRKFERRFKRVEAALRASESTLLDVSAARIDELWEAAKAGEPRREGER
jgi:ATP diphosphatase